MIRVDAQAPAAVARRLAVGLLVVTAVACTPSRDAGWLGELPGRDVAAKPGDHVWYAEPIEGREAVRWQLATLAPSDDGLAVVDVLGIEHADVVSALVQPVDAPPEADRIVVALHPAAGIVVGRAVATAGPEIVVAFDWNGERVEEPVVAARAVTGELSPLEPVAFRDVAGWSRGLVVALDAENAWVADAVGRVNAHPLAEVHALVGIGRERAPGDAVLGFTWADGFVAGTVEAADAAGYFVRLDSGTVDRLAATDLVDPADWFG